MRTPDGWCRGGNCRPATRRSTVFKCGSPVRRDLGHFNCVISFKRFTTPVVFSITMFCFRSPGFGCRRVRRRRVGTSRDRTNSWTGKIRERELESVRGDGCKSLCQPKRRRRTRIHTVDSTEEDGRRDIVEWRERLEESRVTMLRMRTSLQRTYIRNRRRREVIMMWVYKCCEIP